MGQIITPDPYRSTRDSDRHGSQEPISNIAAVIFVLVCVVGFIAAWMILPALAIAVLHGLVFAISVLLTGLVFAISALIEVPSEFWTGYVIVPALLGGFAGLLIGWLRRSLAIRSRLGESLLSSAVTSKFWQDNWLHATVQITLTTITGYLIGAAFGAGGVFVSRSGLGGHVYPFARWLAGSGPGPGDGSSDGGFFVFLALLIAAIFLGMLIRIFLEVILTHLCLKFAIKGASGGVAKHLVAAVVEEWGQHREDYPRAAVLRAAVFRGLGQGALTGVIVGAFLSALRP
jgi:hypothetical protein